MNITMVLKQIAFLLAVILIRPNMVTAANILFYHNIGSYSHRVPMYPLASALADRGHLVTFISPHYPKDNLDVHPNITEIVPPALAKTIHDFTTRSFNLELRIKKDIPRIMYNYYEAATQGCLDLLTSVELQDFFRQTKTLDLVIYDNQMAECGLGIVHKYGAKHISFHTVTFMGNEYDLYGFSPESSAIPEMDPFAPASPMTYLEKVDNTMTSLKFRYEHYKYMKNIDTLVRRYMDVDDMPFLDDLARNVSLIFYTGEVITDFPRSVPPNVVNVAGIHCKNSTGVLPQVYLNGSGPGIAYDGFVYVSLGSKYVIIPEEVQRMFFNTIASFPQLKFLWKWSGMAPDKIPENLYLSKWFSQNDILAHPKIKAFITQSGRPSSLESLCNAVPMIAFPVLSDQDIISNRVNIMGGNVVLELGAVTENDIKDALNKVVYDTRIKDRMIQLKKILNDRPMTPLNTALWWIDYALRHDDFSHLRSATFHQYWYERRLLDVWLFLFVLVVVGMRILIFLTVLLFKTLLNLLCRYVVKLKMD